MLTTDYKDVIIMMIYNSAANFAYRMMTSHYRQMEVHMRRLSSGYRINSAADDPAGLAISEKLRTQINGLKQAQRNIMDGISAYQTAEGALNEIHSILQRMRVLALQAANGTLTDSDRSLLNVEVTELTDEVRRIIGSADFNTKNLFLTNDTNQADTISTLHIGANANQTVEFYTSDFSGDRLNLNSLNISTAASAESAISILANSINIISRERAVIGAKINRLEHSYNFAQIMEENQLLAESRIRDADFAEEMAAFVKSKILAQAAQAMFMQALNLKRNFIVELLSSLNYKK